jgi:quercetin dioxygenase-like cupin family protein
LFNVGMKRTHLQIRPFRWNAKDPEIAFLGARVWVKASSAQTGGAFNIFEVILPAGFETPLHIHYAEDVAIQVLEGALDLFWGADKSRAETDSFFFQPRSTPHGFRVSGSMPARILYLTLPGGFDGFVLSQKGTLSGPTAMIAAAHYKIEVLGPLPAKIQGSMKGGTEQ